MTFKPEQLARELSSNPSATRGVSPEVHELALEVWAMPEAVAKLCQEISAVVSALENIYRGPDLAESVRLAGLLSKVRLTIYSEVAEIEQLVLVYMQARALIPPPMKAQVPNRAYGLPGGFGWMWADPLGREQKYFNENPRRFWDERAARVKGSKRIAAIWAINIEMREVLSALEQYGSDGNVSNAIWWFLGTPLVPEDGFKQISGRLAVLHWAKAYILTEQPPSWEPATPSRPQPWV